MAGFTLSFDKLTPLEKLKRAKIQIQQQNSFFGNLSLYLKFVEIADDFMKMPCGIDAQGNFYYKPKWIEELTDKEVEGLIVHEIMHLALLHLLRRRNRYPEPWNVANDLLVNNIAQMNGFTLPKGGLVPYNNEFRIGNVTICDIDKKTSEEIYDEIPVVKVGGGGGGDKEGWDKHIEEEGKNDKEKKDLEEKWLDRIEEAVANSQRKGDVPKGLASLIKGLHKQQVNWRTLLIKYIQAHLPYDYTYLKPSKKSVSAGFYMPNYLKEKIKVMVGVDMSGSIGNKEVADFMSEIVGIANAYQDRIEMTLLTHDVDVHDEFRLENGVAEKAKKLKLRGGGGTSHKPVLEKIKEKYKDTKIAIFLTDGYSDLERINLDNYNFSKIFVLDKHGNRNLRLKGSHKIINLKD